MSAQVRPALIVLVLLSVLTGLIYPAVVTGIAQLIFLHQANGSLDDSQITEHGASGTWFLTEKELGGDLGLNKGGSVDPNATASLAKFEMPEEGFDISSTSRLAAIDRENLDFPVEPTAQQPAMGRKVDLDFGGGTLDVTIM